MLLRKLGTNRDNRNFGRVIFLQHGKKSKMYIRFVCSFIKSLMCYVYYFFLHIISEFLAKIKFRLYKVYNSDLKEKNILYLNFKQQNIF